MGRENRETGFHGENAAVKFLRKNGYRILERNFRTPFGEIDAIARQKDFTIFVEIKTRLTHSLGPPYLSVTKAKQRHIVKNALCYLKRHGLVYSNWRIDIVSVKLNANYGIENIELIENAVQEQYL